MPQQVFLLSPASCTGRRAGYVLRDGADFPVARQIREPGGAPIGDVFAFLSGLYFRGKIEYARHFARPPEGTAGVLVITPSRGLVPSDTPITLDDMREFADIPIDTNNHAYRAPLEATAAGLRRAFPKGRVVLLGSIATDKYVALLQDIFGDRLVFPSDFVGRGDMSRGGLLLRCVDAGTELECVPVAGAVRRGGRPPRLKPRR